MSAGAPDEPPARTTSPGPTDDELVAACRDGDVRAFAGLLARHETSVLRVLRLLGIPSADREDLGQDVFLRAFRYLGSYRPGRSFAGWLYRITLNVSHDWQRQQATRRSGEVPWSPEAERSVDPGPGPDARSDHQDLRNRLEAALGCLSERERAVFVLCEIEALSTLEVARALGITRITVRRHLGLARRRLQSVLAAENAPGAARSIDRSSVRAGSN